MKLMIVLSRVPWPLEKGDKLRAYHQIECLSKQHEIYLFCLSDTAVHPEAMKRLKTLCREVKIFRIGLAGIAWRLFKALFGRLPFQVMYFNSKRARKGFDAFVEQHMPEHIYCQLVRTALYGARYSIIPKTLDYMDVFSTGIFRRLDQKPFYIRPFFASEYRRLLTFESKMFDAFELKTIISKQDREGIDHPHRNRIAVIPNGVDTTYFKTKAGEKSHDILFTGNMNYPPNVEGAQYLVRRIMPLVWEEMPDIKVLISGATPAPQVRRLAGRRVLVTGWVPDIRTSYAESKIFVAPMMIGTGLQNKLLEAMSMGLPCITTVLANNALGAEKDKAILLASDAASFAQKILELVRDPARRQAIATAGQAFVTTHFDWVETTRKLSELMEQAVAH